jgi:hypothetical protein
MEIISPTLKLNLSGGNRGDIGFIFEKNIRQVLNDVHTGVLSQVTENTAIISQTVAKNWIIEINTGAGMGQRRKILSQTGFEIFVENWQIKPAVGDQYTLYDDLHAVLMYSQLNDVFYMGTTSDFTNIKLGDLQSSKAVYRLNVDPTSNPDMIVGGLIVTAAETATFNYVVPLTFGSQGLNNADGFVHDPNEHLTFTANKIVCNKSGIYQFTIQMNVLSNLITPMNNCTFQILRVSEPFFMSAPLTAAGSGFSNFSGPISAFYNICACSTAVATARLNAGDEYNCKLFLAYDSVVISLSSNICINEL